MHVLGSVTETTVTTTRNSRIKHKAMDKAYRGMVDTDTPAAAAVSRLSCTGTRTGTRTTGTAPPTPEPPAPALL